MDGRKGNGGLWMLLFGLGVCKILSWDDGVLKNEG